MKGMARKQTLCKAWVKHNTTLSTPQPGVASSFQVSLKPPLNIERILKESDEMPSCGSLHRWFSPASIDLVPQRIRDISLLGPARFLAILKL